MLRLHRLGGGGFSSSNLACSLSTTTDYPATTIQRLDAQKYRCFIASGESEEPRDRERVVIGYPSTTKVVWSALIVVVLQPGSFRGRPSHCVPHHQYDSEWLHISNRAWDNCEVTSEKAHSFPALDMVQADGT